jgi:hypothetical protein
MAKCLGDEGRNVGVEEPVDDLTPAAVADHETEVTEDPQLMRDGGLLHLDLGAEITDRARTIHQPSQNLDPARRRECAHESRYLLSCGAPEWELKRLVVGGTHVDMLTCTCLHIKSGCGLSMGHSINVVLVCETARAAFVLIGTTHSA